ncbi:MAG: hypothetical protein ABI183_19565, partial [Polyangiaceae bacterium]
MQPPVVPAGSQVFAQCELTQLRLGAQSLGKVQEAPTTAVPTASHSVVAPLPAGTGRQPKFPQLVALVRSHLMPQMLNPMVPPRLRQSEKTPVHGVPGVPQNSWQRPSVHVSPCAQSVVCVQGAPPSATPTLVVQAVGAVAVPESKKKSQVVPAQPQFGKMPHLSD